MGGRRGLGAAAGQAAGGDALSGANTAINSAMNNRLLHPDEQKTLSQLQQGQSPQEQLRLAAAACALTRCAASLPANNPYKAALQALQTAGKNFPAEQALLTKNGLFGYSLGNAASDFISRYEVGTRAAGALQAVGGAAGAAAGVGIMAAGCETGLGCVAGFALAATGADTSQAGYRQMLTGTYTPTLGQQALESLGLTPTTAAWTYAAIGVGAGVGAAASAFTAADGVGAASSEIAPSSGLSRSAIISNDTAQAFLVKNGMSVGRAMDFIASFDGPITARIVSPGENFVRYTDVADSQGSFLTKTIFPDPAAAVNGLYLGPYGNNASLMQPVTATGRSIILEGGIANGTPGVQQSLIVNRGAFQFGTGLGY